MEMDVRLECGAGIIRVFRDDQLKWKDMLSEWIDNAFDADAHTVTFRRTGSKLVIEDDGNGCDNLLKMQSPARSVRHETTVAGRFGVGGVRSQVRASNGGVVEVYSVTAAKRSRMVIDWGKCIERDEIRSTEFRVWPAPPNAKTGTTITIPECRRFHDQAALVRDLSYYYAQQLRNGRRIIFEIDGVRDAVKPYTHPPFVREVKIDREIDGLHVTGFCGLVAARVKNPYYGWSVHWGHRILDRSQEPAAGRPTTRIYGEVYLPTGWTNVNSHKNDFAEDPEALWAALAEDCREIIEAAEAEASVVELESTTQAAMDLISDVIRGRRRIKGRRPGDAGEEGTVEPTGRGGPHRRFTTWQPGGKTDVDEPIADRMPDRINITWSDAIEHTHELQATTQKGRALSLIINSGMAPIYGFRDDPEKLAVLSLTFMAAEVSLDAVRIQKVFPGIAAEDFRDLLRILISRLAARRPDLTMVP